MRPRSVMSVFGITALTVGIAVGGAAHAADGAAHAADGAGNARGDTVRIVIDHAGIPHITADNFKALGYGEAYAFARDDFCTLAEDFVTVNADRSKYFGPDGLAVDFAAGAAPTDLDSDLFWQSVKDSTLFRLQTSAPPPVGPLPQVRQAYQGFVDGYNAFLRSGRLDDPACAGQPWVRPITLRDLFLRGLQIAIEGSSTQFISAEAAAAPPASGTAPPASPSPAVNPRPNLAALRALRPKAGSNGIGIGAMDSRAGDGMLLANPHFPWVGEDRFFMTQLTVPGRYDMEGGTLMGFPFVGIGFNSSLAWTHTVSTDQRFTFFQLKLVPGDPTSYFLDGKPTKMGTETVTVGNQSHTFYTTRFGTVISFPQAGYLWTSSSAYTVDDVNFGNEWRAANQYFEMGRATSVSGLLGVEEHYLATPLFNTIAADKTGHALYADVGNTPNVPATLISRCLPPGLPTLIFGQTGLITLDGSTTSCAWRDDRGTPIPGIFSGDHEPHTIRTDYVENSNDSYWLANPSAPFGAFSPVIGDVGVQQGMRTRLGNALIAARVVGTDGLGKPKFTIDTLQRMWESDKSLLAELVLDPLVTACEQAPVQVASNGATVDLTAACKALNAFKKYRSGDLHARGGWLFTLWADSLTSPPWAVPFSTKNPLTTPNGLDTANQDILRALADAVQNLQAHNVPLDAPFGAVQHETRGKLVIPIHGCGDEIGCFNAIEASRATGNPLSPGGYGEVNFGSSLVITAELTPHGPVAEGILTYSQATDPNSPFYANMTRLYSKKHWVSLAYTPRQLAGDEVIVLRV